MAKDLQDKLAQATAYCNLGLAYKALGEFSKAEECQRSLLSAAQALDHTQVPDLLSFTVRCCAAGLMLFVFQAVFRALGNLGDVCVCRGDLPGAVKFYQQQLTLAQKAGSRRMEGDAFLALGSAHR